MNAQYVRNILVYLYKMMEAGERGYAVAASNVSNPALKILLKSYAQKRLKFKAEILAELQRLDGHAKLRSHFLGLVHRGRIDIFAALTIGAENVEKVVLKEVLLGEKVAISAYEKALKKDLPLEIRETLERHLSEIRKVVEQVRFINGQNGKRLVLGLYDSKREVEQALQSLKRAGYSEEAVEIENWNQGNDTDLYRGQGTTILETIISGSVGGALWGIVSGILSTIGIIQISSLSAEKVAPVMLLLAILGLITGGAFIGGMIGLFIGWGIASEDRYVYEDSLQHGEILMRTIVDTPRSSAAWRIMEHVAEEAGLRQELELDHPH